MQHQVIKVPAVKTRIERIAVEEVVVQTSRNQISITLEVEEAHFLREVLGAAPALEPRA